MRRCKSLGSLKLFLWYAFTSWAMRGAHRRPISCFSLPWTLLTVRFGWSGWWLDSRQRLLFTEVAGNTFVHRSICHLAVSQDSSDSVGGDVLHPLKSQWLSSTLTYILLMLHFQRGFTAVLLHVLFTGGPVWMEHSLSQILFQKNTELVNHKITVKSFSSERTHNSNPHSQNKGGHMGKI